MKKKPVNRANFRLKGDTPPPNMEDLLFQSHSNDTRFGGQSRNTQLSPNFFNSYLSDKSLTWEIGNEISKAGEKLK